MAETKRHLIDHVFKSDPDGAPTAERAFDITGVVTMARVRNSRMAIALDDGREFEMPFNEADEEKITRALHERNSVRVRVKGMAEYSNDGLLHRPLTVDAVEIVVATPASPDNPTRAPLWLMIEEIMSDVSDEEMARIPPANSRMIDQKLYGKKADETRAKK